VSGAPDFSRAIGSIPLPAATARFAPPAINALHPSSSLPRSFRGAAATILLWLNGRIAG
jgi:hypothetical protein